MLRVDKILGYHYQTSTRLSNQKFETRLEKEPGVGTPILQYLSGKDLEKTRLKQNWLIPFRDSRKRGSSVVVRSHASVKGRSMTVTVRIKLMDESSI